MTAPIRTAPAARGRRIADWRRSPATALFLLPCIVIFGVFLAYPLLRNIYVGTFDWNGLSNVTEFVGLDNFVWVFTSPAVLGTAVNTLIFGVVTVSLQLGGGFLLAVALSGAGRLRQVLRTIFFIPVVLTPVVVGYLFSRILEPNDGDLRNLLDAVGLGGLNYPWLADPRTALYAVALVNVWLWVGFSMSVYQSALTNLPPELVEAARIDGARSWQVVRHVVLPFLRPTHWALLTLSVIGTLKTFDIVYVLTKGGPNGSTELPTTLLFKIGFDEYRQGRAAALGTVLFVVALVLTIIQLRLARSRGASS
jgi:ABC-type sugar transport system permease subunit